MDFSKFFTPEYFAGLAPKIRMSDDALNALINLIPSLDKEEVFSYCNMLLSDCSDSEAGEKMAKIGQRENDGLTAVIIYMTMTGIVYEQYKKIGIPDSIFYNTMNCLPEKMETYQSVNGRWGFDTYAWPISHMRLKLFRLERLGFQIACFHGNDIVIEGQTLIRKGDKRISIHISDRDPFTHDLCVKSYEDARDFFPRYFPEHVPEYFHCETWLLHPSLRKLLPESSNIVKFQKDYTVFDSYNDNNEVFRRVFGGIKPTLDDYATDNSLRKKIIEFIRAGNSLGRGKGVIKF